LTVAVLMCKTFADYFVAYPFGHQLQHFNLAGAQVLFGWGTHPGHKASGDGRGKNGVSPGGGADAAEQFFTGASFSK
jgi:hypothetical protein